MPSGIYTFPDGFLWGTATAAGGKVPGTGSRHVLGVKSVYRLRDGNVRSQTREITDSCPTGKQCGSVGFQSEVFQVRLDLIYPKRKRDNKKLQDSFS